MRKQNSFAFTGTSGVTYALRSCARVGRRFWNLEKQKDKKLDASRRTRMQEARKKNREDFSESLAEMVAVL